jgi:DNA-binding NarL/FixJ family response regulator
MAAMDVFKEEGWAGLAARLLQAVHEQRAVRVLVVDDHVLFAEMLTLALELGGRFQVVGHAHDGRQAIEEAAWLRPDVVLMDVQMPVLDGIEATPRVLAAAPGTKVIVVSSSQSADDRRRAREAGAVAFLGKESSVDDLVRALERVVFQVVRLRPRSTHDSADQPSTS